MGVVINEVSEKIEKNNLSEKLCLRSSPSSLSPRGKGCEVVTGSSPVTTEPSPLPDHSMVDDTKGAVPLWNSEIAKANAQILLEVLDDTDAGELINELLIEWTNEQKTQVKAYLTPVQIEQIRQVCRMAKERNQVPIERRGNLAQDSMSKNQDLSVVSDSSQSVTLEGIPFPLYVGQKIRCYPTLTHADKDWKVIGTILSLDHEKGLLRACEVEYRNKDKEVVTVVIAGGNREWILSCTW